jgi:hypothetical protein
MNRLDSLVERLRKATKFRTPTEQREYEAHLRYVTDPRNYGKPPIEEDEVAEDEDETPHGDFLRKLGIPRERADEGDPYEESRTFLDACDRYDARLAAEARTLREVAANTSDDGKRRRAERRLEWVEHEREDLENVTTRLWGRTHKPVLRWKVDEDAQVLAELRCKCRPSCPRLFRDKRAGNLAGWRHPSCRAELAAERHAAATGDGAYIEGLLSRLL